MTQNTEPCTLDDADEEYFNTDDDPRDAQPDTMTDEEVFAYGQDDSDDDDD